SSATPRLRSDRARLRSASRPARARRAGRERCRVIRRLNHTGRRNIARSAVTIRLLEERDGERAFTAEYDLSGMRFPDDARVYIEAYNTDSYMRFAFGTVAEPQVPKDTRLVDITARPLPKFRLKVVDETH